MATIYFASDKQESPIPRRHVLEMAGYRVQHFTDSAALLAAVREQRPDLVLIDVLIEGQNGFEVCRQLRGTHAAETLPIVLSTTIYRSRVYREEAERLGAQAYILRPQAPEELLAEINRVLGHEPRSSARGHAA